MVVGFDPCLELSHLAVTIFTVGRDPTTLALFNPDTILTNTVVGVQLNPDKQPAEAQGRHAHSAASRERIQRETRHQVSCLTAT